MSVERMTNKALWSVVGLKVAGDLIWGASAVCKSVGSTAITLGNILDCHGRTCLMVESHFGKRYEDITGRSLGTAANAPSRHAMTEEDLPVREEE